MPTISIPRLLLSVFLLVAAQAAVAQRDLDEALLLASVETIQADAELGVHVQALAQAAIGEHCAACHGADLTGRVGVPNLVDFDWNWGVTGFELTQTEAVFEIMQTILFGVRSNTCPEDMKRYGGCPDTRFSQMPGYGELGFTDAQLDGLVEFTLGIGGKAHDDAKAASVANLTSLCAECHGEDGTGYKPFGGPDLSDDVWLFGGSREEIRDVIARGRTASCPAWNTTLDAATIKALSVYIYSHYMGL